jgi:renalase
MKKFAPQKIAVIGAGIAGLACARTLLQAGHRVTVLEKAPTVGGRMTTRQTDYGSFDHGVQYFTVRDARFKKALATVAPYCKPWTGKLVEILNADGQLGSPSKQVKDRWVGAPTMSTIAEQWAAPFAATADLRLNTEVTRLERSPTDPTRWQLTTHIQLADETAVDAHLVGFDQVVLATTAATAQLILANSLKINDSAFAGVQSLRAALRGVKVAPCWTVMLAFPLAADPAVAVGPRWDTARSSAHRVAWVNRETGKSGRQGVERWTIHASTDWSVEHFNDGPDRVEQKLIKSFAEITGIHAAPSMVASKRWNYAKTTKPLGQSYMRQPASGLGICGDYCLGHRVEDAFVSGLELALAMLEN